MGAVPYDPSLVGMVRKMEPGSYETYDDRFAIWTEGYQKWILFDEMTGHEYGFARKLDAITVIAEIRNGGTAHPVLKRESRERKKVSSPPAKPAAPKAPTQEPLLALKKREPRFVNVQILNGAGGRGGGVIRCYFARSTSRGIDRFEIPNANSVGVVLSSGFYVDVSGRRHTQGWEEVSVSGESNAISILPQASNVVRVVNADHNRTRFRAPDLEPAWDLKRDADGAKAALVEAQFMVSDANGRTFAAAASRDAWLRRLRQLLDRAAEVL